MISKIDQIEMFKLLCQATKKWGVFISFSADADNILEVPKAAPYLSVSDDFQIIADGVGVVLCDTEQEASDVFWATVGDDGPTETNPYKGNVRVYALTCNPEGVLLNENT